MLAVLLFLALVLAGLILALYAAALAFQVAFYEQRTEGLGWRAAAAAGALVAFLALAAWLDAKFPDRVVPVYQFTLVTDHEFEQFWSEKTSDLGITTAHYRRAVVPPGRVEFVDSATGRRWQRSDSGIVTAIIVEEAGERKRFAARLDDQGNFPRDPRDSNRVLDVEYVEEEGNRVMSEATIGRLSSTRPGAFLVNLLFNLLHLALWIAAARLLLDLQWHHAVLVALIGWAVIQAVAWVPLQERVRAIGSNDQPILAGTIVEVGRLT